MRPVRALTAVSVVAIGALASPAVAQDARPQALFAGSVGYTDNVTNQPSDSDPATPAREGDVLFVLAPGGAITIETPRTTTRIGYTFTATLYGSHTEANTIANTIGWATRFETSPTTSLLLGVDLGQGELGALNVTQPASDTRVEATPTGQDLFVTVAFTQGFEKAISEETTLFQGAGAGAYLPLDGTQAFRVGGSLGARRDWEHDQGSVTAGTTWLAAVPGEGPAAPTTAEERALVNTLTVGWGHSWGYNVGTQLNVGVLFGVDLVAEGAYLQPLADFTVRYARDFAQIEATVAHVGSTNLALGTNGISDSAVLRLTVPLGETDFSLQGSGGVTRSREIDDGEFGPPSDVWATDAALLWAPFSFAGALLVAARYQHLNQIGYDAGDDRDFTAVPSFVRNTVLGTVAVAFPDVAQATAPPLLAAPYRPQPEAQPDILRQQDRDRPARPGTPGTPTGPTRPE